MSSRSSNSKCDETTLRWHTYRYFPYEKILAEREVISVLGVQPVRNASGLTIPTAAVSATKIKRLAYVRDAIGSDSKAIETIQGILERSINGATASEASRTAPRRQSTRYSAHGLHEYKGKFNPQVVRAIGNILSLEPESWILDPFCGSGTTLLEALHGGWNAVGTDLNPLAIEIANAKIAAMDTPIKRLLDAAEKLEARLVRYKKALSHSEDVSDRQIQLKLGNDWSENVPNFEYLIKWFPRPVLAQLALILRTIEEIHWKNVKQVFRIVLSDILREVSLQEPADLRIRRRKNAAPNYPAITVFLSSLDRKLKTIQYAQRAVDQAKTRQQAIHHDSRRLLPNIKGVPTGQFDAAITSPPYATALPYIDTQRLSLCLLGLIDAKSIAETEGDLIGAREITTAQRVRLSNEIESNEAKLPREIHNLSLKMLDASLRPGNGFRRQNTPGLIYRYFAEMQSGFKAVLSSVKPGGSYVLLVGSNRTSLGGHEFIVETPYLLAKIAQQSGWQLADLIDLETYQRYDLHHKNSIRKEGLIVLKKPE